MKTRLLSLIRSYQNAISPRLPPVCRFTPSCSHYGYAAIEQHGVWAGGWLTFWRLLRCNPLCRGGLDPVPPRRERHRLKAPRKTDAPS